MWQKQPIPRKDNPIYSKKGQIIKKTSGLNYQYPFTVDPYLLEKYKEYIIRNNLIPPVTPPIPRVQVFKSRAIIEIPDKWTNSNVTISTILSLIQTYDENISTIFNNYSNFYLIYNIDKNIQLHELIDYVHGGNYIGFIAKQLGRIIIHKKTGSDVNIYLGFDNNIIYYDNGSQAHYAGNITFQYFRSATEVKLELIDQNTDITFILLP